MAASRHKRRIHSSREKRRLAAVHFLSNISLDGTHNDTKLRILNSCSHDEDGNSPSLSSAAGLLTEETTTRPQSQTSASRPTGTDSSSLVHVSPNVITATVFCETPDKLAVPIKGVNRTKAHDTLIKDGLGNISELSDEIPIVSPNNISLSTSPNSTLNTKDDHLSNYRRWSSLQDGTKETPTSLLRASSYSGDRERVSRKKATHSGELYPVHGHGKQTEKDRLRRSSSISADSSDSSTKGTKDIKFILPDRLRRRFFRNERLVFVSKKKTPAVICSTLAYTRATQQGIRRADMSEDIPVVRVRHSSGTSIRPPSSIYEDMLTFGLQTIARTEDGQDVSYGDFLVPSRYQHLVRNSHLDSTLPSHDPQTLPLLAHRSISHDPTLAQRLVTPALLEKVPEETDPGYDPYLLDDPELSSGSYRTLMTFPSYITSVIDYVRPSELKKEVNEKFRLKFPQIQLTLSKLRSLKREMKRISLEKCGVDLWTIAQGYVFFEKLILKHLITKPNRKLCAGACLMLSAKLNDVKGMELSRLIECIEEEFRLHRKEMLAYEIAVLVALEFSLHISDQEVYPHYQRLIHNS